LGCSGGAERTGGPAVGPRPGGRTPLSGRAADPRVPPSIPGPAARRGRRPSPEATMAIRDIELRALDGSSDVLSAVDGKVTLVVNVASKCGLTPQYAGLQRLHERYEGRG